MFQTQIKLPIKLNLEFELTIPKERLEIRTFES